MRLPRWALLLILIMLLVPWLGETLFNTKGEPREAIVAVSMLNSGNWVLPVSLGQDIPYKPPFLAWLIALFSKYFNGGVVNEFTSRLPSALAAIAMIMGGYAWARRYTTAAIAGAMAIVTITCFEVYRAAVACRVDMLLTACMVLGLYQMYFWRERGIEGEPWWLRKRMLYYGGAILYLSGAVLAKGPVGALLPCLAIGIFCLLRGDNFFKSVGWLALICLCSMVIPSLWYMQAYEIGGEEFLRLAYEENIGRLTGTMSYESHVNPWPYNLLTIITGMLPWTLFVLIFCVGALLTPRIRHQITIHIKQWRSAWSSISAPTLFAWTIALVVLIFYCIPSSKRSVYLLPMYPFMAMGVAHLLLQIRDAKCLFTYNRFLIAIAILLPIAGVLIQFLPMHLPIERMPWWRYPLAFSPWIVLYILHKCKSEILVTTLGLTLSIYFAYASAYQPMILNAKSDKPASSYFQPAINSGLPLYMHISYDDLMRYYTLNFYLQDRIKVLPPTLPAGTTRFGLISSPDDAESIKGLYPQYMATTDTIISRSCDTRRQVCFTKFSSK